jgi:hypothetical protein
VLAWPAFISKSILASWVALPLGVFVVLVLVHDRVIRKRRRLERAVRFYESGIARLEDRWIGLGDSGIEFLDPHHPYAVDLDLFGKGSLFELLCTARTSPGRGTLASWLLSHADPASVRARQVAVEDLRMRLDLREDLAALGSDATSGLDSARLERWCTSPPVFSSRLPLMLGRICTVLDVAALIAWLGLGLSPLPLIAVLLIQVGLAHQTSRRSAIVMKAVERPGEALAGLSRILERVDREELSAPLLRELQRSLATDGVEPAKRIAALGRLIDTHEWCRNFFFAPIAIVLNWSTEFAYAIDRWRIRYGRAAPEWLRCLGEIEALCVLAGHAYENPNDPFPEIVEESPLFDAVALGHPLISRDRCVRNDVSIDGGTRVLVVSGSNMSGKSTLLRTVGTNVVLALAGAPVRAKALRLSPIAVGASIRTIDSLQEGTSRFYAEIKRLRQLVEIAEETGALLFLIDEILHGTNSHDRRIGAEAVVRGLVARGAVGLLTTHDLALSRITEDPTARARNVHFEDRIEGERIVFDYLLRPGIVEKSNALDLMRTVGLDV